jgi:hypothetical protein
MAYIQKNNPIPRTGCGRRRSEQMTNPFKKVDIRALKKVSKELKKASNTHAGQADKISEAISGPMKKISAGCKAWAKRRYDVWPSAYASGAAVKRQKAGKC